MQIKTSLEELQLVVFWKNRFDFVEKFNTSDPSG